MNYGFYLSAAGVLTSMHRQDVIANNLANTHTRGFKADMIATRQRLPERLERGTMSDPQLLLERLGGGKLVDGTRTAFRQGALLSTDAELDFALGGEGFFVLQGSDGPRLTRDGRFTLNARSEVVHVASGLRLLGPGERPIRVDPSATLAVSEDGRLSQNGNSIGSIMIAATPTTGTLVKEGQNLFHLEGGGPLTEAGTTRVRQGFVENSTVNPVLALNDLMRASKSAQANVKMMQYQDQAMNHVINTMGRVA